MSSADHWTFLAHVLLKNAHIKSADEATAWLDDFTQHGCVDSVRHGTPYQHLGLGWVCSIAFLVSVRPDSFLKQLNAREVVASAAIDRVCGDVRPYTMPADPVAGQFNVERWPDIEGMTF